MSILQYVGAVCAGAVILAVIGGAIAYHLLSRLFKLDKNVPIDPSDPAFISTVRQTKGW